MKNISMAIKEAYSAVSDSSAPKWAKAVIGEALFGESRKRTKKSSTEPNTDDTKVHGPEDAAVYFVGLTYSDLDRAMHRPLSGKAGKIFNDVFLKALGCSRDEVAVLNVDGDAQAARDILIKRKGRSVVVALSKSVATELGDGIVDYVMPHPEVIAANFDSGEVARKMRQVKAALASLRKTTNIESTLGDVNWDTKFFYMIPSGGAGRFVYQHHWSGMTEDMTALSDEQLRDKNVSVHSEFRLEGDATLYGWYAQIPNDMADPFMTSGAAIRGESKSEQDKIWLRLAYGDDPHIFKPGDEGSGNENTWGKVFNMSVGTYRVGVATKESLELFLNAPSFSGRYLVERVSDGGTFAWLLYRPSDQRPTASTTTMERMMNRLKAEGHRALVWPSDDGAPVRVNLETMQVMPLLQNVVQKKKTHAVKICKADESKRIVYGVVLDPYLKGGDTQGDVIPPADVEKTAHDFMKNSRMISIDHARPADADVQVIESFIEQYPSQDDYRKAMAGEPHAVSRRSYGGDVLHSGAWVLGTQLNDELWGKFKSGELQSYSIEGFGTRSPLQQSSMPQVTFVDLLPSGESAPQNVV